MSLDLDKSAWKRRSLGAVAAASKERVDPTDGSVDRYVAGEHMDTDDLKIHRWGDVAEVSLGPAFHRRFRPGQVLYGSRRTYLRKLAVANFAGVCANTTFVVETRNENVLLQEFLPFVMCAEPFHAFAIAESKGSVNPYVNWSDVERFEFDLPPLHEQKRIAGLLWAIEHHRLALLARVESIRELIGNVTVTRLSSLPTTKRLGDLATTRSGPSFAASDVHDEPATGAIPVLGIPNTKPGGAIDLAGVSYVTGLPGRVALIDESSLILIRTNGNRQRIGNVYLPPTEAHGHAVSAFQFLMQVHDASNREFLFWVLSESGMQQRMTDGASGSVGLGNLAVRWLNEQEIPWSADATQRVAIIGELKQLSSAVDSTRAEVEALAGLRANLLAEIFGGN